MRVSELTPVFVVEVPDAIAPGTLYVSMQYGTAVHLCCCSCGNVVVTPFSPTDWQLTFDGERVSLRPSIGNWSFPCRSHYWITGNRVGWAPRMSMSEIAAGRTSDRAAKEKQYERESPANEGDVTIPWWRRTWMRRR